MTETETYTPGHASGAEVQKNGEEWTLVITRDLRHSPEKVWEALTDPKQLREWAPMTPTPAWPPPAQLSNSLRWERRKSTLLRRPLSKRKRLTCLS